MWPWDKKKAAAAAQAQQSNMAAQTQQAPPKPQWTNKDQDRWNELQDKVSKKMKKERIEKFKKLPGYLREKIIAALVVNNFVQEFNDVNEYTYKTNEQSNLERKWEEVHNQSMNGRYSHYGMGGYHGRDAERIQVKLNEVTAFIDQSVDTPTIEELQRAHMDLAADEELLGRGDE